ncbi:MAG: hypothetical protein CVV53_05185, partial [Spirochaetae bacterium HGW-Spirochaetae-9]
MSRQIWRYNGKGIRKRGKAMKKSAIALGILLIIVAAGSLSAQPVISEKQDIAIFALGYYGWNLPYQALGAIDGEIQKVFADLGRFTILGMSQRLSPGGLEQFIATVRQTKQSGFVLPEKFQFGEAFLTEQEFNRLVGAFVVVVPVVVEFNSWWDYKNLKFKTEIKTTISFIEAASGSLLAIKTLNSSGSDANNEYQSISAAIASIPMQLQYEIRSIPQFQISTRILRVNGSTARLQMGSNMGIMKGDEYAVVEKRFVEGFDDSREVGLIVIKDVGREVSSGQVLYTSIELAKDTQLQEIPRLGLDLDLYLHIIGTQVLPGLRLTASRGFYALRPFAAAQIPLGLISSFYTVSIFPVNVLVGLEYVLNAGRLSIAPSAAAGLSYYHVTSATINTDTDVLSHIGFQLGGRL